MNRVSRVVVSRTTAGCMYTTNSNFNIFFIKYYRDCHSNSFSITSCGLIAVTRLLVYTALAGYFTLFFTDIFNETNKKRKNDDVNDGWWTEGGGIVFFPVYIYIYLLLLWLTLCLFFVLAVVFLSVFRWSFLFHVSVGMFINIKIVISRLALDKFLNFKF